ncbi:MAG: acyl--CoA ligase [Halioglobus sp.]|nr:acyl--CoA ligase [Halioglobus sp.]
MITSSEQRILALTSTGHWGSRTLHGLLEQHAWNRPSAPALKDQPNRQQLTGDAPQTLTWVELDRASESLAIALQDLGVRAGDKLLVQLPNVVELAVIYYAASKLGAIISPVPVQYGSHELQMIAQALEPTLVITLPRLGELRLAKQARAALPEQRVVTFGSELHLDTRPAHRRLTRSPDDANRVLSICWTSGTTGTPKGVPRSHNMWLATARCSVAAGSYTVDDVLLNPFPLVNMAALGGFLFPAALLGCAIVLHHPLDPPQFLRQMQDEKITFTIAPPALLNQLAKSPDMWRQFDFSSLRSVGSGSAPLAPWMIETFGRDYGVEVINFYGSNEGISLFATPQTAAAPEVRAAMFPRPPVGGDIATRVADPDTGEEVVAAGARGELLISGATVFDGYLDSDNTAVFSQDGYFRTGDLVEICGENSNYYRIVGRCKDIINRGGMKISPAEIDLALEQHPGLLEAAVCAYPDERLGEKICACLVLPEEGGAPTLEDLQAYLSQQGFAKFKLPERIELLARLPRNPLGKVQRFALQDIVGTKIEEQGK